MALNPQSPQETQAPARSAAPAALRPVTAAEGQAALRAMGDPGLLAQAQVYGRANRIGGIGSDSFWRNLPPDVAQAVLNGRYEATKAFFETWGKSIAHNAREGKRVSQVAMQRAQELALQELNSALRRA